MLSIQWCVTFNVSTRILASPWLNEKQINEQAESGKQIVLDKIANLPQNSILAFTDGSCINNPGPCGAGAVIFNGNSTIELKKPVSNRYLAN